MRNRRVSIRAEAQRTRGSCLPDPRHPGKIPFNAAASLIFQPLLGHENRGTLANLWILIGLNNEPYSCKLLIQAGLFQRRFGFISADHPAIDLDGDQLGELGRDVGHRIFCSVQAVSRGEQGADFAESVVRRAVHNRD